MKTAQVLLFVITSLLMPVGINASSGEFIDSITGFPDRSIREAASWFGVVTKDNLSESASVEQVLGSQDLTNSPVIEQSQPGIKLADKMGSTQASLDRLSLDIQQVLSEAVLMGLKWDSLTIADLTQSLDKQNAVLEETLDDIDWLSRSWGWSQLDDLKTSVNTIKGEFATVRSIITTSGKLSVAYEQLKESVKLLESVSLSVGEKSNPNESSLYYIYSDLQETIDTWHQISAQLNGDQATDLKKYENQIMSLNTVPNVSIVLDQSSKDRLLGLRSLVNANLSILAQDRGATVVETWIEESANGNLLIKTLVANPSLLGRQEIALKYYLPVELTLDDIVQHDSTSLQILKDDDRNQLYAQGNVVVAAGDARVVVVETRDLWKMDNLLIDATRSEAADLLNSLVSTAQFVEAASLKGQIDAKLSAVSKIQLSTLSPIDRIRAFREVDFQLAQVQNLVTQLRRMVKVANTEAWPQFAVWREAAMGMGGMMFMLMGVVILKQPAKAVRSKKHKNSPALDNLNIFSGQISISDL